MTTISIRNLARLMQAYKIRFTTLDRAFLKEAARAFDVRTGRKRGRATIAMYLGDIKRAMPEVEFYLDEAGRTLVHPSPEILAALINDAIIHEDCHAEGFNERQTRAAVKTLGNLLKPMVWKLIKCQKTGGNISWDECLRCSEAEKHDDCPILPIREFARERDYKENVYHVTELTHPRRSFFNRTIGYAKGWTDDSYVAFLIGRATHRAIQSSFSKRELEIRVARDFGGFMVVGSADIISEGTLYELKTYASLATLIKRGRPEPDHVWQALAYYSLLRASQPWLARTIKTIKIIYLGKTGRGAKQYKEFKFKPKDISDEILSRTTALHEALKSGTPPAEKCPAWLCNYCEYTESCGGIKRGFRKNGGTFKKFLIQHKRGVEQVAEMLRKGGRVVKVNPLAVSDVVIPDPAQKQRPEWDIEDLAANEKIDVKTTTRNVIWCNARQLEKAAELDLIYYFVFVESGEVRRIAAAELYKKRATVKSQTNQFGERGFVFPKDVAEVVG